MKDTLTFDILGAGPWSEFNPLKKGQTDELIEDPIRVGRIEIGKEKETMNGAKPITTVVVKGYSGGFAQVASGQYVRITDLDGGQVGDMFAISTEDHTEFLSPSVTRLYNLTLFPSVGQAFYSNRDRLILVFIEDHSPGCHDMLMASCNKKMFEALGVTDHPNCRDNYFKTAFEAGIHQSIKPDPVNFFQNTPVMPDGSIAAEMTISKQGDYVVLRAETNIILILTACSTEMINHGKSSPLRVEIFDEKPE